MSLKEDISKEFLTRPLLCYCRGSDDKDSFVWLVSLRGWMCQRGAGEHLEAATGFEV